MPHRSDVRVNHPGILVILIAALGVSSPHLGLAGAWVMEKNSLQAKLSFFSHSTSDEFILTPRIIGSTTFDAGERLPYAFGGKSISRAYLLDVRYGALSRLEVGARFSYYDLQFDDDGGSRRNTGPGDLYAEGVFQLLKSPAAVSVRAGAKAPTGEFDIDPERVPLSENQWDLEGALAGGKSFYPLPGYASAEAGYRYRFENSGTKVKPGNEFFFTVEAGAYALEKLFVKVVFAGLFASERESREFGFLVRNQEGRKILSLSPYVAVYPVKNVFVETGAKFLLAGRDYPAGVQYLVALGWRIR